MKNLPGLILIGIYLVVVFSSSLAIYNLFGSSAQILFMLPIFIVSLLLGRYLGSVWPR